MHVEIWSDVVCPWCYIGKRRFEAALEAFEQRDEVEVTWRSFQLDPHARAGTPGDRVAHLARKYSVSDGEARAMLKRVTDAAAGEGLDFRFDLIRGSNSFDAHRVLHLAKAHGVQDALVERLMYANFTEGAALDDPATLERLAAETGVPAGEARDALAGDGYAAEVRDDDATGRALGITGVPFFVVERRFGVSGAQSPELLLEVLERGRESESRLDPAAVD